MAKTSKNSDLTRIAILLDHPGHGDSRVLRMAEDYQAFGAEVSIFALHRSEGNSRSNAADAHYKLGSVNAYAITFDDKQLVPHLTTVATVLRPVRNIVRRILGSPEKGAAFKNGNPTPPANGAETSSSVLSFTARVNQILGALFWHSAMTEAFRTAVCDYEPTIIHANDLSMLGVGANLAAKLDAKLIYDSHELEMSRNDAPDTFAEKIRVGFERHFIPSADVVITVSESLAEVLKAEYRIQRPIVIVNVPSRIQREVRSSTRADFELPEDVELLVYVGSLAEGRGIEAAIECVSLEKRLHLAVAGFGSTERVNKLIALAESLGVADRVHYLSKLEEAKVTSFLAIADYSVIPIQPSCFSYDFCLPNKLFQSLFANVQIIAFPTREVSCFMVNSRLGILAGGFDGASMRSAVLKARKQKPAKHGSSIAAAYAEGAKIRLEQVFLALSSGSAPPEYAPLKHITREQLDQHLQLFNARSRTVLAERFANIITYLARA